MATRRWLGAAADIYQVNTVTIANTWATSDTITLTINGIDFIVTIGANVTTAQVATTLKQAFNGETLTDTTASYVPNNTGGAIALPMFSEVTATVSGSVVTLTGNTAGRPFTMTAAENTAGDGTATMATPTAATGKNFGSNADNWSGATVPVDNDDIVFDSGDVDLLFGLSMAIQPASVRIDMGYTGRIGLGEINEFGGTDSTKYPEYRTKYLTFDDNTVTTTYLIGRGEGQGSDRIRIDAGAGRVDALVTNTGSTRASPGEPAFTFKGTHASNAIVVQGGDAGIGYAKGDTTVVATLRTGTDQSSNARVYVGDDVTLTTFITSGGTAVSYVSCTTHTQHGGNFTQYAGAPATLNVWGGVYYDQSATTIGTACLIGSSGTYDRSKDNRAKTIAPQVELHKGSKFLDPNSSLTLTNGYQFNGCKSFDCEVDFGNNRSHTVS